MVVEKLGNVPERLDIASKNVTEEVDQKEFLSFVTGKVEDREYDAKEQIGWRRLFGGIE